MIKVIEFNVVVERLRRALGLRSDRELATSLGLKSNAFYNRKRLGSLPYEEILELADKRKLSADWIFYGLGQAFHDESLGNIKPVAEIDSKVLQEICFELERALSTPDSAPSKDALEKAAMRGGLAAFIYQKVAFIDKEKVRRAFIQSEAKSMAAAVRVAKGAISSTQAGKPETDIGRQSKQKPTTKIKR